MRALAKKPKAAQQSPPATSPKLNRSSAGQDHAVNAPLPPQRTSANQAVPGLLQTTTVNIETSPLSSAAPRVAPDSNRIPVYFSAGKDSQPNLKIDASQDHCEQQPDSIAGHVIQKKKSGNEAEKPLQNKACSHQSPNPSSNFNNPIVSLQGGGRPLPQSEQAFFEPRFGTDFSQVRVHADRQAAEAARAVNARAFTLGRDIVFGTGEYQPRASEGKKLLAHELAHVVQQGSETNNMAGPQAMIQRDDITQMSITPQYARGLSDEDLEEQVQIIATQTLEFEFPGTSTLGDEEEVTRSNLSLLQEEQGRRQRQRALERRRRNRAVTATSITPSHAEALSDEDLREQMQILSDQLAGLEFLGTPGVEGEEEVARSNFSLLQEERRRRNRAVMATSITPSSAESLSDEDLQEQMQILSDQLAWLEFLETPAMGTGEEEVARSNLSILSAVRRSRRSERRRRSIHGADWGSFRTRRDIDAVVSLEDRTVYVMETLVRQYHYPVDGAAALVGNFMVESGGTMAPNILEGGRLASRGEPVPRGGGVGLAQWTGERREAVLETEQGVDILFDVDAQLAYTVRELQRRYARVNAVLNNPPNLDEATRIVYEVYEAPQPVVDAARARRAGDPTEIQRTTTEMNRVGLRRRDQARRARDLYRREHPEE